MQKRWLIASLLSLVIASMTWMSEPAGADCGDTPLSETPEKSRGNATIVCYEGPTWDIPGPKVVTLGDSYASGTGIHRNNAHFDELYDGGGAYWGFPLTTLEDDRCNRETDTTPGPRLAALTGARSIFMSCAAAEFEHVNNQLDFLNAQWPADAAANWDGAVFITTGGGNDVRTPGGREWGQVVARCYTLPRCDLSANNQFGNLDEVAARALSFYTRLATEASGATIRVQGYPYLMRPSPGCASMITIGRSEARWIDENVDLLNERLMEAMAAVQAAHPSVDIAYVDTRDHLSTGACAFNKSDRHINNIEYIDFGTSSASLHPTQLGYDAFYDALLESL